MRRGQGACSCVAMFYEAGQEDGDWRLYTPQRGIRGEGKKNRVLIKGKCQSSNSHLIFSLRSRPLSESKEDLWIL